MTSVALARGVAASSARRPSPAPRAPRSVQRLGARVLLVALLLAVFFSAGYAARSLIARDEAPAFRPAVPSLPVLPLVAFPLLSGLQLP